MRLTRALLPILVLAACTAPVADEVPSATDDAIEEVVPQPPPTDAEIAALVAEQTRFGLDLYARLREGAGNRFLSPFSVAAALSMTYAGAAGETAAEMRAALGPGMAPERLHTAFGKLQADLLPGSDAPYELAIANALWTQQGKEFRRPFLATLERDYASELQLADFASNHEEERARLNDWVLDHTRNRIENLFPRGSILPTTRLVLANAIAFLGTWEHPFSERRTREGDFHLADGSTAKTPMMSQTGTFSHGHADGVHVADLPYEGGRLSMTVILPDSLSGLAVVEAKLSPEWLAARIAALKASRLHVRLPKFQFSHEAGLAGALQSLGVRKAFTMEADFSPMDGTDELYLQAALHKAFVKVDEKGTEAAAATGMVLGVKSVPPQFDASRPFLFLIRDRKTGAILFLGRLVEPAWGS